VQQDLKVSQGQPVPDRLDQSDPKVPLDLTELLELLDPTEQQDLKVLPGTLPLQLDQLDHSQAKQVLKGLKVSQVQPVPEQRVHSAHKVLHFFQVLVHRAVGLAKMVILTSMSKLAILTSRVVVLGV
jgi:hypothetical protein